MEGRSRSRLAAAASLALLLAGCLGATVPPEALAPLASPARAAPEVWKAALSQPTYEGIASSVHYLAAADGTQLALTLHLPEGLATDARIPVLLQITPYQAGRMSSPLTGTQPAGGSWSWFVERGAAYVEADARGTNASEGCLDFGGSLDRADAAVFVAWIRAQPWSNGVVVSDGVSHPGMGSLVAHTAVTDLTAALAHAPVVSYYRDEWYQGAKFEDQFNGPGYQAVETDLALYSDADALKAQAAPCSGATLLDFSALDGPFDEHWADRDLSRHVGEAAAPVLLTQGFVDQNVHPDHVQLYWDALPDDFPKHVVWGWWYHGWPDLGGHPSNSSDADFHPFWMLRHRWIDATLFGLENGVWSEPRVLVEDSLGQWHEGRAWPLEPSAWVTLHPTAEGALAEQPGAAGEASYLDALGAQRGSWEGASVAFRSEALAEARLVNGAPVVDLVATGSEPRTKWVAYLLDEAPDGTWQRVSHGYADSRTWAGEAEWRDLEPGKPTNWTIQLMPTAVVVEPGHRLVLLVASQDSRAQVQGPFGILGDLLPQAFGGQGCFDDHRGGCYLPSGIVPADTVGRATNTVFVGEGGTRVRLAWVDPALTAKPPWAP